MDKKELLSKVIEIDGGGLTRDVLIKRAKDEDEIKLIQKLISEGYLERYTEQRRVGRETWAAVEFIRVSDRGYRMFYPLHKKIFLYIKDDIRVFLVSAVTASVTTLVAIWLHNIYEK